MSQNFFGRLGQIRHGLAVSTLFALTVFVTLLPAAAFAVDAQPKRKDSNAFIKPKEVVLSGSVEPAEAKAGDVVTYTVTAKVAPGWHIYQYKANPEGGVTRDTYFDFFDPAGLKPVGDWTAAKKPIRKAEPAFNNEILEFYENEARWSLKLQIPPGTAPGPKTLRNQAIFQICDANSCKPPARSTLPDVTLTVVPGVGGGSNAAATAPTPPPSSSEATVAAADVAPTGDVASEARKGLLSLILVSATAGLLALVMPCVWPMIPITVNFFVKQGSKNKGKTTGLAVAYCLAIIGVFTSVGVLVSFFFSATALQNLANNPWLNAFVAFLFLAFGLSLLGLFEVRLPNFLLNVSSKGEGRGGMIGVMFMALTLTITSFTCTFPVVGGLIVMAANGEFFYPIVGLATFSSVLAFPFFLLALAPGLVSKMPKSGDWMNSVKVVGGLIEVGAALKFINSAEIGFGVVPEDAWFDAPLVLSAWVGIAAVCGLYLLGLFRTDHDHEEVKIGPGRLLIGSLFLALALFLAPALFGNPPKSPLWDQIVGILPPDVGDLDRPGGGAVVEEGRKKAVSTDPATAEREEKNVHGVVWGMSYDEALEVAKASNKPVLIDFTGVNCVNCRKMEQTVLNKKQIVGLLSEFVTVQLFTDKPPISSLTVEQRMDVAEKNQLLQLDLTKETTNPFYVVLNPDGQLIQTIGGYNNPLVFGKFLNGALTKTKDQDKAKVAQADPVH
ncbi:protein-disulfide reductase DsbD family protein [Singulisphaera sp. GP187]|uniref:protein-disulfide reductase DsbD family protein n=1 Tax=Singulisphaera sp. GP187 TaxID=1882752 RepID=UPI0009410189|nr:thioredoxin family protein [Singulisphaera sp. GP187]